MTSPGWGRLPAPAPLKALPGQRTVIRWREACEALINEWRPALRQVAAQIADNNDALTNDLVQEALVRLWQLDPARYGPLDLFALKRRLVARMRVVAKHEWRAQGGGRTLAVVPDARPADPPRPQILFSYGDIHVVDDGTGDLRTVDRDHHLDRRSQG